MNNTSLEEVKEWLRIDGGEEDVTLLSLLNFARAEIYAATGVTREDIESNVNAKELYNLMEKIIVATMYDDRTGKEKIHKGLNSLFLQLKGMMYSEH